MNIETPILIVVIVLSLWTLVWKIFSVWTAARNGDRGWFFALLLLNTLSILDLWYLFKVVKIPKERITQVFKRPVSVMFNQSVATPRSDVEKEADQNITYKI